MKHSVNKLMTLDFWRICMVSGLLHLALFLLFPILPFAFSERWGLSSTDFAFLFFIYIIGMLLVSPFHAWLADAFKRKYVLMLPLLFLVALPFGFLYVAEFGQLLALMLGAGVFYGLALSVGNTISIDIVESERRSKANVAYVYVTFFGAFLGVCIANPLFQYAGFEMLCYVFSASLLLALLLASAIYVAFRAPIGFTYCSIDRFFLPRTWPLAVNMLLTGLVPGLLMPLIKTSHAYIPMLAMLLILLPLKVTVTAFVKLSEHCQRATAVHSCFFSTIVGLLLGAGISTLFMDANCSKTMALLALAAAAFCVPFSLKYYHQYKIRK